MLNLRVANMPAKVSLIVVSYNRADDLRLCLESILALRYSDFEVIVVDNASKDHAPEVAASFPGVRLLRNRENLGFAAGVNAGLAVASGAYIGLVNNDAVLDENWASELVGFLEGHEAAAAAGGKQYFWNETNPLREKSNRFWGYCRLREDGHTPAMPDAPDAIREVPVLSGSAVIVRRSAIEDVGEPFLDPIYFLYFEESDFFARAVRKGWRLYYVGAAACWHRQSAGTEDQPYLYHYYMQRNCLLFAHRHLDEAALARVLGIMKQNFKKARRLRVLRLGVAETPKRRAIREAWRWANENRALLTEQRALFRDGQQVFNMLAHEIEQRAAYYGHTRPEVAALVPASSRYVVDVGCGGGGLGAALKLARPGVQVRGIEPVEDAARLARGVLDDVQVGSAEDPIPPHWPRPDCVVFADVLEHLENPWHVLEQWRAALAPGGAIVVSVPNISHASVLGGLWRGRWDYATFGILDRTHLRFFTRATAIELLEKAGFRVERLERVENAPRGLLGAVVRGALRLDQRRRAPNAVAPDSRASLADIGTYQYLLVGRVERSE